MKFSLMKALCLVSLITAAHASAVPRPGHNPFMVGVRRALENSANANPASTKNNDFPMRSSDQSVTSPVFLQRGGGGVSNQKPPAFLQWAYKLCGLATAGAWTTIAVTTIRSNQPTGMMMPSYQHGLFARIGVFAALPLMFASFGTLSDAASKETWEPLSSTTARRHNLALVTAGVGGALWTNFASTITKIPGTDPLQCHQAYTGLMRNGLVGSFGATALLCGAVWVRSLPESVRGKPLAWPGRIADGVTQSLVSLAPANRNNPVNVKYSVLATSYLVFTGLQLGSHPLSAIPSWTGRRLSRAFPIWTLLAAVTSFNLKEASESKKPLDDYYDTQSQGLKSFAALYLVARFGAIFFDPSFPGSYHAVKMVPAWATAGILTAGLTLRPDTTE